MSLPTYPTDIDSLDYLTYAWFDTILFLFAKRLQYYENQIMFAQDLCIYNLILAFLMMAAK